MHSLATDLIDAIESLPGAFQPGELPYLALTSKPEYAIRDRLSFILQCSLDPHGLIVAREWKRRDLVVLDDREPLAVVEFKSMYTFDGALRRSLPQEYKKLIERDIEKALGIASTSTEIYAFLSATHACSLVPQDLYGVIKYAHYINSAIEAGIDDIHAKCEENVLQWPVASKLAWSGKLTSGEAMGLSVSVLGWLFGPYFA